MALEIVQDIKDIAVIANLVLVPVALFLWKIDTKLTKLSTWAIGHEEKDDARFTEATRARTELVDRVKNLERG
jgi:hypothetical protein